MCDLCVPCTMISLIHPFSCYPLKNETKHWLCSVCSCAQFMNDNASACIAIYSFVEHSMEWWTASDVLLATRRSCILRIRFPRIMPLSTSNRNFLHFYKMINSTEMSVWMCLVFCVCVCVKWMNMLCMLHLSCALALHAARCKDNAPCDTQIWVWVRKCYCCFLAFVIRFEYIYIYRYIFSNTFQVFVAAIANFECVCTFRWILRSLRWATSNVKTHSKNLMRIACQWII